MDDESTAEASNYNVDPSSHCEQAISATIATINLSDSKTWICSHKNLLLFVYGFASRNYKRTYCVS